MAFAECHVAYATSYKDMLMLRSFHEQYIIVYNLSACLHTQKDGQYTIIDTQGQKHSLIQSTRGKLVRSLDYSYSSETATAHSATCFQSLEDLSSPIKMDQSPYLLVVHKH